MGFTKRTHKTIIIASPEDAKYFLKKLFDKGIDKMNNQKVVTTPVKYSNSNTAIQHEVTRGISFDDDDYPEDCDNCVGEQPSITGGSADDQKQKNIDEGLSRVEFADAIKVDFITSIDYRILCRHLGVSTVGEIKNHPYQSHPLITLILMESAIGFMDSIGYDMVGELNFDSHGNSIPPEKNPWSVKGKETTFTITGFVYFKNKNDVKTDNVAYFFYSDLERGGACITCYSTDTGKSKDIVNSLEKYSKANNVLRGAKLKDVNMISASFSEVEVKPSYTWENYYYTDEIKDMFKLEVFDFVKDVKRYNECNITKRGIILHGKPGTGKTTIGNIICNMVPDNTVIWITPEILQENNYKAMSSIKALYKLADFLSPCIIMLEDLDLFSQDRDRGGDVLGLGALMNILDGINTISNSVTIGTTNRLQSIETALANRPGRFDKVIEIPPLSKKLRTRMFKDRLEGWKVSKKVMSHIADNTDEWTGAEIQEFINSLNLKHISSNRETKSMSMKWADEILENLSNFGVGEASSNFGFGKKKNDD